MVEVKYKSVDVFTDVPFRGNPAGVVLDADELSDELMQQIASELGFPQTAFVLRATDKGADFRLRFFTPRQEVDLCGHGTLAAFWALAESGVIPLGSSVSRLVQQTNAGHLAVELHCEGGAPRRVMMTQAKPVVARYSGSAERVSESLGLSPEDLDLERCGIGLASTALMEVLVPVKSLSTLQALRPNLAAVEDVCREAEAVSMHCFSFETVSRFSLLHVRNFAPLLGIAEEAATGTGNGALAAYLVAQKLVRGTSPLMLVVEQGHVMGRASEITVEIAFTDTEVESVRVGGKAVSVADGKIRTSVGVEE